MEVIKLHAPTNIALYGPTQCGKTRFVLTLLKNANVMFTKKIDEIYYCYEAWQECYEEIQIIEGVKKVNMFHGLPSVNECKKWSYMKNHIIVVFDDLMTELSNDKEMVKFVTVYSHHMNITMIVLLHNIFPPKLRTMSLNTHYVVLFKNKRDTLQVETFARRVMHDKIKYFFACYKKAVSIPYGYLFVDLHPHSDEKYELRTRIFPYETPTIVYVYKK